MNINYIILAHKNPEQVERLVNALSTGTTFFYIHIDKNTTQEPFEKQLSAAGNCQFLAAREKGTWGDVGIVKATLHALQQIVTDQRGGYCVLLSGQDYPIKSNQHIAQYLALHRGSSFIETTPLPSPKWDHGGLERMHHYKFNLSDQRQDLVVVPPLVSKDFRGNWINYLYAIRKLIRYNISPARLLKKRSFPAYIKPCAGSQWWALPVEVVEKMLDFLRCNPDYLAYHQYTLLPDEIALQSIVRHLVQADTGVEIQPPVAYANWERPGVVLPVTFDKTDLNELLSQPAGKLFARKFDAETDTTVLDLLDRSIGSRAY